MKLSVLLGALSLALLAGCGGAEAAPASPEPQAEAGDPAPATSVGEAEAQQLAHQAAIDEGIAVDDYVLDGVEPTDGGYWVTYTLPPPTPPGGHFGVFVSDQGETRVHLGE